MKKQNILRGKKQGLVQKADTIYELGIKDASENPQLTPKKLSIVIETIDALNKEKKKSEIQLSEIHQNVKQYKYELGDIKYEEMCSILTKNIREISLAIVKIESLKRLLEKKN